MLKFSSLLLLALTLSSCSLYESAARKYLESSGIQFKNTGTAAEANFVNCNRDTPAAIKSWEILDKGSDATLFSSEDFELRVQPAEDTSYNCYYKFSSAQELYTRARAATELTLAHLNADWVAPMPPPKAR